MSQITTMTFFKFPEWQNQLWAFSMMQKAHPVLSKIVGQTFYKLMASGSGIGFNVLPDRSTFVLLQVWQKEGYASSFFDSSPLLIEYRNRSSEVWTTYMRNTAAKGRWHGLSPFIQGEDEVEVEQIVVLTRAKVKWNKLIGFWRQVPASQQTLAENEGLIYTKGVGEIPLIEMATLSFWKDEESIRNFAYKSSGHAGAIRKAKTQQWFSEELFARFKPYRSVGTWNGKQLLQTERPVHY